jgi:hypothetical protein
MANCSGNQKHGLLRMGIPRKPKPSSRITNRSMVFVLFYVFGIPKRSKLAFSKLIYEPICLWLDRQIR